MHLLLTDLLTCPRCGPEFGLIVLSDRLEDRHVREGRLGCANCRETFPITAGVADLRHATNPSLSAGAEPSLHDDRAYRTAALLGVTAAQSTVLVVEPTGEIAPAVAGILAEVHVIGASAREPAPPERPPTSGVLSRVMTGSRLPIRSRSLNGIAFLGVDPSLLLDEAARVLVSGARLVADPASPELGETLRSAGFRVHLEQESIVVAATPEPG